MEDDGARTFNLGEIYRLSGRSECLASVLDDDIKVAIIIVEQLLNLSCCSQISIL